LLSCANVIDEGVSAQLHDGIGNYFITGPRTTNSSNAYSAADANGDFDNTGYTTIEKYVNSLLP
jgi:hypothetical protein